MHAVLHRSHCGDFTFKHANASWALPMYELMCEHLVMFMDDTERPLTIREAACAGHEKLMHYYKIARESMHVIVAMGVLFHFFV
jgi:hypothetical protein